MIQRCLTFAFAAALSAPLAAQDVPAGAPAGAAGAQEVVFPSGDHELGDVVGFVSDYLGVDLLLDASECMGGDMRVRTRHDITVDREGAWELLNSVLNHRGMAVIPLNRDLKLYEIINLQGAKRSKVSMNALLVDVDQIDRVARWNATPVLCRVPLENTNATIATNALRPFFAQAGGGGAIMLQIGNMGRDRELILQGMGDQVAAAVRLIRAADQSALPPARSMSVVALQHIDAATVAQQLDAFLRQSRMHPGMQATNPDEMVQVVAAPEQNAVLVSGSGAQIKQVIDLIEVLDVRGTKAPAGKPSGTPSNVDQQIKELTKMVMQLQKQVEEMRKKTIR